jgi:hypothetical protein
MNRISFGAGLLVAPGMYGRTWIGAAARDPATKVFARALGARDLALGLGALATLDDPDASRRWFLGHALADGADVVATWLGRDRLPAPARAFALVMAAGSTVVGALSAARPPGRPAYAVPVGAA